MSIEAKFIPLPGYEEYPVEEMRQRLADFQTGISKRRSVRDFSDRAVPRDLIETAIAIAATAPSGANHQPWHFVAVSAQQIKHKIREAAEEEERAFYAGRAGEVWLDDLKHLGTDAEKPFLETAPWLIAIFAERHGVNEDGSTTKNYYVSESVGIATGFLIAALNDAGLATLTHTPSPMNFLNELCGRPKNEKPYILLVVGYPAPGCQVPEIARKPLDAVCTVVED